MFLLLGNGNGMRIEEMTEGSVATDQYKLFESCAGPALLEKPEESFDCNVHHIFRRFFASGAMQDMSDSGHGATYDRAVGNTTPHNLQPRLRLQLSVVAKSAHVDIQCVDRPQYTSNEIAADLAGRASDKDVHHRRCLVYAGP